MSCLYPKSLCTKYWECNHNIYLDYCRILFVDKRLPEGMKSCSDVCLSDKGLFIYYVSIFGLFLDFHWGVNIKHICAPDEMPCVHIYGTDLFCPSHTPSEWLKIIFLRWLKIDIINWLCCWKFTCLLIRQRRSFY